MPPLPQAPTVSVSEALVEWADDVAELVLYAIGKGDLDEAAGHFRMMSRHSRGRSPLSYSIARETLRVMLEDVADDTQDADGLSGEEREIAARMAADR